MDIRDFFTPLESLSYSNKIKAESKIMTIGSCFSTEIGQKLMDHEFDALINPFGTVFNPISIFMHLEGVINGTPAADELFIELNGRWYHYHWHSSIFGITKEDLKAKIENIQKNVLAFLKETNVLILTFGSSIVRKLNGKIVSNCHKQPSKLFSKEFLSLEEILSSFNRIKELLKKINPKIQIITTTSPIRHTKEGLMDNSRSKSLLNVFNQIIQQENEHLDYFPSYEILMDVLRDYRYYKPDLIHPNSQAVDYIWHVFTTSLMHDSCLLYLEKMSKLIKMNNHILQQPKSENGMKFGLKKQKLKEEIKNMKK